MYTPITTLIFITHKYFKVLKIFFFNGLDVFSHLYLQKYNWFTYVTGCWVGGFSVKIQQMLTPYKKINTKWTKLM